MSEWQPIETAPRDGTVIIAYGKLAGEISGIGEDGIDFACWGNGRSDYEGNSWWECTGGDYYQTWIRATHWMPAPAPPKDDSAA